MVKEMTVAQFAHKLKVDRSTVYRMINAKALPNGVEAFVSLGKIGIRYNEFLFGFPTGEVNGIKEMMDRINKQ